ncbi:MAG: hypothetical protein QOD94_1143 [Alphaproteobacteria bacterium]|jgi:hypothetical protein|nr:hypothetical protein [Alphaproteobacteria bacterium]
MMLKQISLAALAATFITGSAVVAYAESNISGVDGGETTSAALLGDWASSYGNAATTVRGPSTSMDAYGYAGERRLDRSHQRGRTNARMNYNN